MLKRKINSLALAGLLSLALLAFVALVLQVEPAASQGDADEAAEVAAALAAEQEAPVDPSSWEPQFFPVGQVYPLFIGVDDTTIPAYTMDPTNNATSQAFVGTQVWGSAYDPINDRVFFNSGSTLYEWPVGGAVNQLGTMVNGAGAAQTMVGLAFYDGVLYGTRNIAPEAVHIIDPNTLVVTQYITYPSTHDMGGVSIDPDTGIIYATDDGSTDSLVIINPDGSVTPVAPYPAGFTDIDGLAVGDGKAYMVTDDANGNIFVYDLVNDVYLAPLVAPWPTSEVFAGGAWIYGGGPAINLVKTVGTDPNVCAATTSIQVPPGTDVTYCFNVTNSGTLTLTMHDLDDSELGSILSGFNYSLTPGASVWLTSTTNIVVSTTNTAVWTACNVGIGLDGFTCASGTAIDVVTATATADVTVVSPIIDVSPPAMTSTQVPNTVANLLLTISNLGDAALNWTIQEELAQGGEPPCNPADLAWLSVAPTSGTTAPAGNDNVSVTFDSTGLTAGTYTGNLCIDSDDPVTPVVRVPVTLVVIEPTDVALSGFTSSGPALLIPIAAALLLAALAGAVLIRRRQAA